MSDLIQKIENKINRQNEIPNLISKIDSILLNKHQILTDNDIQALKNEKLKLNSELITVNQSLEEKHKISFILIVIL